MATPQHVNFSSREAAAECRPLVDVEKIKTYISMQMYALRNEVVGRAEMATDAAYRESEDLYDTMTEFEQKVADYNLIKRMLAMVGK